MPADIEKRAERAVGAPHQQDRHAGIIVRHPVAGARQQRAEADIDRPVFERTARARAPPGAGRYSRSPGCGRCRRPAPSCGCRYARAACGLPRSGPGDASSASSRASAWPRHAIAPYRMARRRRRSIAQPVIKPADDLVQRVKTVLQRADARQVIARAACRAQRGCRRRPGHGRACRRARTTAARAADASDG